MRRLLHILYGFLIVIAVAIALVVIVLNSSKVQTGIVRVVTEQLSDQLQTEAHISSFDYDFPNHLHIDDIFIADRQGDTLLAISHATVNFRLLDFFARKVTISEIELRHGKVNILKDIAEVRNFDFILDYFKSDRSQDSKNLPTIQVKDVWLNDISLRYLDLSSLAQAEDVGSRRRDMFYKDDVLVDSLNLLFSLNHLSADSIDAEIKHLYVREKSGFEVSQVEAQLILTDEEAYMPKMSVCLPHSRFATSVVHAYFPDSTSDIGKIRADLRLDEASVVLSDLAAFAPSLRRIDDPVSFNAAIYGSVDSLTATDLQVMYHSKTLLSGDVRLRGLPDLENTYFRAQLQDLMLDPKMLEEFLSDLYDRSTKLTQTLYHLGTVHYHGQLVGKIDSLQLSGAATSRLGNLTTDGLLRTRKHILQQAREESADTTAQTFEFRDMAFRGKVATDSFALGELLGAADLGDIAMNVEMDGHLAGDEHPLHGKAMANIERVTYRDYTYRDIRLDGDYDTNGFQGTLRVNDENVAFDFGGEVNLSSKAPKLRFDMNLARLRLDKLNLTDKLSNSDLRLRTNINLALSDIDHLNGTVVIDSLRFENKQRAVEMQQLRLTAYSPDEENNRARQKVSDAAADRRQVTLQSDFVNASLSGNLPLATIKQTLQHLLSHYLPLLVSADTRKPESSDLELQLSLTDIDRIAQVLGIDFAMNGSATINANIAPSRNSINLTAEIPKIHYNNFNFSDLSLDLSTDTDSLKMQASALQLHSRNAKAESGKNVNYSLNLDAADNQVALGARWFDKLEAKKGSVATLTRLLPPLAGNAKLPIFDLNIQPSSLILKDSVWTIAPSQIIYNHQDTVIDVRHLEMATGNQMIVVNGIASPKSTDSLYVALSNIDLDYVLNFTHIRKQSISFSGLIDGWARVYATLSNPMFEADARIDGAYINEAQMGDAHAIATLDKANKRVVIDGTLTENGRKVALVDGEVLPSQKYWGIDIDVDSARLAFIEHWTHKFLRDIDGRGYGHIKVFGKEKDTYVVGKVFGDEASFLIPVIGTRYSFTDTVVLDTTAIIFRDITAYDDQRRQVKVNGVVGHKCFKNFDYDMHIEADRAHVVALSPAAKGLFYGDAYATGTVDIRGSDNVTDIKIAAQTEPRTNIYLSVAAKENAKDDSFVEFVSAADTVAVAVETDDDMALAANRKSAKQGHLLLGLQLDVDDDAAVNLLVGKNGDLLRARGHGPISIEYDDREASALLRGDFTISSGTFDFTLQNLIHRSFSFQRGSRIIFDGNAANPEIDATAVYSTTASLRDLFGTDYEQVGATRSTVPVNCLLYLKGRLSNPTITFGIELPQSEEGIASQVRSIINTDEMLMREIIYLLAFNRFYTPEYMKQSTAITGLDETYSLLTSTLTGQINNWLSKITDNFTVGFNFRTDGEGSNSSQEYETQFQIQPTSRLLINGNVGYRYNDISNQPVFGNLDVEYLLTPSGQWRAKAYTHSVDKYSLREAATVQGIGLRFQQDFNVGDFKKNKEARRRRREEAKQERRERAGKPNTNRNLHKQTKRSK